MTGSLTSWPKDPADEYVVNPAVLLKEMPPSRPTGTGDWEHIHLDGMSPVLIHIYDWLNAIHNGDATEQGAEIGHRTAACAHMINASIETKKMVTWDRQKLKMD